MKMKIANRFIAFWLTARRVRAITLPPFGIYALKGSVEDEALASHERVHWQQYQRMGCIGFYIRYFWYQVRYGYDRNPMEIEARSISGIR
jgi:hypothetical protein